MPSRLCLPLGVVATAVIILGATVPLCAAPPNTLAEALKQSTDRQNRRVPLMAIDAEKTQMGWENNAGRDALYKLYAVEGAKPPIAEMLAPFRRQIVSCSTVQVIAPINRVTVNPYPGKPEEWARVGRERAAKLFFASLSPAQWATASSTAGIGLGNLTKQEQKVWFLSLIPDPFMLEERIRGEGGEYSFSMVTGAKGEPNRVTVSPEQVRLRVVRSMSWLYKMGSQNSYTSYGDTDAPAHEPGEHYWAQSSQPQGQETAESYRDRLKDAVRIETPNRLQKGDLSFNAPPLFGKTVRLSGIKTVGELVQRVAESTGLELYADRRLTASSVTFLGPEEATADAADIVKALCLAVTGTVRKVTDSESGESVYIVTGDHDGLMPPRLRLAEWAGDVDALLNAEQQTFEKTARSGEYIRGIGFAENTPAQLDGRTMQSAEERMQDPQRYQRGDGGFIRLPVTALPAAGQARVRRDMAQREQFSSGSSMLDDKNVYAQFSVKTQLLVPGYGAFSGPNLSGFENLLPRKPITPPGAGGASQLSAPGPIILPPALQRFAALKVVLKDDSDAESAATWAEKHGFSTLLIPMDMWSDADRERISRAIAIAQKHGVKIYPSLSLLRVPVADASKKDVVPNNLSRAQNIFGETLREYALRRKDAPAFTNGIYGARQITPLTEADWLDISDKQVREALAKQLATVARMPGIAGIVWENVAAPGMVSRPNYWSNGLLAGQDAGYTSPLRVALIRQENIDPVDLPPYGSLAPYIDWGQSNGSAFLGNEWEVRQRLNQNPAYRKDQSSGWSSAKPSTVGNDNAVPSAWNSLATSKNAEWIGGIRQAANLSPTLSVYYQAPVESFGGYSTPWTAPWVSTDPLPPKEQGSDPFLPVTLFPSSSQESVRQYLASLLTPQPAAGKPPTYGGIIIDTTAYPLADALALLAPLASVAK